MKISVMEEPSVWETKEGYGWIEEDGRFATHIVLECQHKSIDKTEETFLTTGSDGEAAEYYEDVLHCLDCGELIED